MKKKINKEEFNRLLSVAECDRMTTEIIYITATDEMSDFHFDYNIRQDKITEQGIALTESQYKELCKFAGKFIDDNEIDLQEEERDYPPINHYNEFGLTPEMFF